RTAPRRGPGASAPVRTVRGTGMTSPLVLAIDGGNSKTDLALLRADGEVVAVVRGPQSSPHHLGVEGCISVLDGLLEQAREEAGLAPHRPRPPPPPAPPPPAGVHLPPA